MRSKKGAILAMILAAILILALTACEKQKNSDDMDDMDLWKTIDALAKQIPFSQEKVEIVLSTQLTEKPLGSGNNLFHLFESEPVTLADGVIISNVDLRVKRSGDHPGFLVLELDAADGTGVTLEQVQAKYSKLTITNTPRGDSLEEEFAYSQNLSWGTLTFGFKARDPERLASIAFDPKAK